jgi:uncharacterized protein (UPF0276 family)
MVSPLPDPIAPFTGFGLGLRPQHYDDFLTRPVPLDFVEVISENFMIDGGRPLVMLERVRDRCPVALHGVSMSIGSADGLDEEHLRRLCSLADRIDPLWVSDHLCWTGFGGFNSHDLLPLPYTDEAMDVVCANIHHAQEALGRALVIENPSSYLTFPESNRSEWEFIAEMAARTGCYLLLDVNNIFVSATNHGFDPIAYLDGIPGDRIRQMHLAGHSHGKTLLIDTHDAPVPDPVWSLYAEACARFGPTATMIERDDHIPPLDDLLVELAIAREIAGVRHAVAA